MKHILLLILTMQLLACHSNTNTQVPVDAGPIIFSTGTLEEAVEASRAENKPIFLAFHATWCPPCKVMDAEVYTDPTVASFFNSKFINYKIDAKAPGARIAIRKFGITNYPTLVFADSDGDNLLTSAGMIGADQLLDFGKEALGDF